MKVIAFHEKYGNRYYDASTPELLDKACQEILCERFDEGYYDPSQFKLTPLAEIVPTEGITDPKILEIVQKNNQEAEAKNKTIAKENRYIKDEIDFYNDVIKCLASDMKIVRDHPASYYLIKSRGNYEYEGVKLIEPAEGEEIDKQLFISLKEANDALL